MLAAFARIAALALALAWGLALCAPAWAEDEVPLPAPDTAPPAISLLSQLPPDNEFAAATSSSKLQFSVSDDGGSGLATTRAWFNSRPVKLDSTYALDTRTLREAKSRLIVLATDGAGNSTVYSQEITVDRTAPLLVPQSHHVFGPFATLDLVDRVSGPVQSRARVRVPKGGVNEISLKVRDRAGNVTERRVLLLRHVSLGTPRWNRGVRMLDDEGNLFSPNAYYIRETFKWQGEPAKYSKARFIKPLVREAQWRLMLFGALARDHTQTGVIDLSTINAVRTFQKAYGITPNGTIGPATRRAMDKMVLEHFAPGAARHAD